MPDNRKDAFGMECIGAGVLIVAFVSYISGVVIGSRVASNKFANLLKDIVLN